MIAKWRTAKPRKSAAIFFSFQHVFELSQTLRRVKIGASRNVPFVTVPGYRCHQSRWQIGEEQKRQILSVNISEPNNKFPRLRKKQIYDFQKLSCWWITQTNFCCQQTFNTKQKHRSFPWLVFNYIFLLFKIYEEISLKHYTLLYRQFVILYIQYVPFTYMLYSYKLYCIVFYNNSKVNLRTHIEIL